MNYLTGLSSTTAGKLLPPVCSTLDSSGDTVAIYHCDGGQYSGSSYLCQIPSDGKQHVHTGDGYYNTVTGQQFKSVPQSSSRQTWPGLDRVNVTVLDQHKQQCSLVTCSRGHLTHMFLSCDVATSCLAEHDVIYSLRSQTWALPTLKSCPVALGVTSLPPSFPCQSDEWRVPYSLVCDHRPDCLDGSDETFCTFTPCYWHSQFQCLNQQVCFV